MALHHGSRSDIRVGFYRHLVQRRGPHCTNSGPAQSFAPADWARVYLRLITPLR